MPKNWYVIHLSLQKDYRRKCNSEFIKVNAGATSLHLSQSARSKGTPKGVFPQITTDLPPEQLHFL